MFSFFRKEDKAYFGAKNLHVLFVMKSGEVREFDNVYEVNAQKSSRFIYVKTSWVGNKSPMLYGVSKDEISEFSARSVEEDATRN